MKEAEPITEITKLVTIIVVVIVIIIIKVVIIVIVIVMVVMSVESLSPRLMRYKIYPNPKCALIIHQVAFEVTHNHIKLFPFSFPSSPI